MKYRNYSPKELERACSGMSAAGIDSVRKALAFMEAHSESKETRAHQLNTAYILADLGMDASTVSSALVHELLFEGADTKQEMAAALGKEIAGIAEDIARLKSVKNNNYGVLSNAKLAKVIMGIAKDFRSLFVELASQVDKIRAIEKRSEEKKAELAGVVHDVYAPIAHKLGLYELEWEMQDLALKRLQPKEYEKIKSLVGEKREQRDRFVRGVRKSVRAVLEAEGINATVTGRAKSFYGIYKKMFEQSRAFKEIGDLYGVRVICDSVEDCYRAMGLLHMNFEYLGEYDDYIAAPKQNNYQSIHTVLGWKGKKVEAQIRTWEMHRNAEEGLAAHWKYKRLERDKDFDQRLTWVKQFVEWQRRTKKTAETMRSLKLGFGKPEIFVLTPKKEIITLGEGATALDFAFAIHSDIGSKCKSIAVNGKIAPLGAALESGDVVEVNVSKKPQVKRSWLGVAKTERAKSRIRKALGITGRGKPREKPKKGRTTSGLKKTAIAKCCSPLPGDKIKGFRTTKRKVTIHSAGCPFLGVLPDEKKVDIAWGGGKKSYAAKLKVKAFDRAGMLIELLSELEKQGVTINSTDTKSEKGNTIKCVFDVELKDARHFDKVKRGILSIPAVLEVGR